MEHIIYTVLVFVLLLVSMYIIGRVIQQKILASMSILLSLPIGFLALNVLFFFIAVPISIVEQSATLLFTLYLGSFFVIFMGMCLFYVIRKLYIKDWVLFKTMRRMDKFVLCLILLMFFAHGILQIGFWNVDNSMSDNSFYVTIANVSIFQKHLYAINMADGLSQTTPIKAYLFSTYDLWVGFTAKIFMIHPAIFFRLIMPVMASLLSGIMYYLIFKFFLQKNSLIFMSIVFFLINIYFMGNYRGKLDDYNLNEWYLFFNYTGKVILRFFIIPFWLYLAMNWVQNTQDLKLSRLNENITFIFTTCFAAITFLIFSPGAKAYFPLMFITFIGTMVLVNRISWSQFFKYLSPFFLALPYVCIQVMSVIKKGTIGDIFYKIFTVENENFSLQNLLKYFVFYQEKNEYWYFYWDHILLVFLSIGSIIFFLFLRNTRKGKRLLHSLQEFFPNFSIYVIFGILFSMLYVLINYFPPIILLITSFGARFGYERTLGANMTEIYMIIFLVGIITYTAQKCSFKLVVIRRMLTFLLTTGLLFVYIFFPQRPMTYIFAMDASRRTSVKFKDDYYNGMFHWKKLLVNPYKIDAAAEELVDFFAEFAGKKIVAGSSNQFFGLTHVRNKSPDIAVIKTRFSDFKNEEDAAAAVLLRDYFSPWQNDYKTLQAQTTLTELRAAKERLNVNYIVVVKEFNNQEVASEILPKLQPMIIEQYSLQYFVILKV